MTESKNNLISIPRNLSTSLGLRQVYCCNVFFFFLTTINFRGIRGERNNDNSLEFSVLQIPNVSGYFLTLKN